MNRRLTLVARAAMVLVGLGLIAGVAVSTARAEGPADLKGKAAPDFTLKTVNDKTAQLSQLKGNVVVVDFWATWCPPCRASLPHIQKLATDKDKFKEGLRVLAVNSGEAKGDITPFLEKNKFTFVVPMDAAGAASQAYGISGIPTTLVIGRDGVVAAVFVGFDANEGGKGVDEAVEAALKKK